MARLKVYCSLTRPLRQINDDDDDDGSENQTTASHQVLHSTRLFCHI